MEKIIKYGFRPIDNAHKIRGQNEEKGKLLFEAGHILNVMENILSNRPAVITASVVAMTKISQVYNVKLILSDDRRVTEGVCNCKGGANGDCKHIFGVVAYINSPETALSKTSVSQQWGKPSKRQLKQYQKAVKIRELYPPPPFGESEFANVQVCKLESLSFPDSLGSTMQTMVNLEKRNKKEIVAAETLASLIKINEKINSDSDATKLVTDIVSLQLCNQIYSVDNFISTNANNFYLSEVSCDVEKIIKICIDTLNQCKSDEWFKQRVLRITASNAHKLKGDRFDVKKVISDLLTPNKVDTQAMAYGRKMENTALKEYKQSMEGFIGPLHKIVKVGLIVNMCQPWISCSPDAVVEYGTNVWQKRLVEIKCPSKCKIIAIYDRAKNTCNVQYLKINENGLQLSKTHSIYTQIQVQMYVTNIAYCDLYVYSPVGSVLISVARDNMFLQKVIPKLEKFYFNYYLEQLIIKFKQ